MSADPREREAINAFIRREEEIAAVKERMLKLLIADAKEHGDSLYDAELRIREWAPPELRDTAVATLREVIEKYRERIADAAMNPSHVRPHEPGVGCDECACEDGRCSDCGEHRRRTLEWSEQSRNRGRK